MALRPVFDKNFLPQKLFSGLTSFKKAGIEIPTEFYKSPCIHG
jgi:hypothetical protein